jgi:hypothetical protein
MPVEAVISTNCGTRKAVVEAGAAAFWATAGEVTGGKSGARAKSTKPRAAPRNIQHNRPCITEHAAFTVSFQVEKPSYSSEAAAPTSKTFKQGARPFIVGAVGEVAITLLLVLGADRLYHL